MAGGARRGGGSFEDPSPLGFVPGGGLTTAVLVLLTLWIPIGAAGILVHGWEHSLLGRIAAGDEAVDLAASDARVRVVGIAKGVLLLATAPIFIAWYRRVYRNLRWFGAARLGESLGWATGSWVVPVGNYFVPYWVMQETWRGSDPMFDLAATDRWRTAAASGLIRAWWFTLVCSSLLGGLVYSIVGQNTETIDGSLWLSRIRVVSTVTLTAAAATGILVVRAVNRRQREKARGLEARRDGDDPAPA